MNFKIRGIKLSQPIYFSPVITQYGDTSCKSSMRLMEVQNRPERLEYATNTAISEWKDNKQ